MTTMCVEAGCYEPAVGVGYWQGRRGTENPHRRRPNDRCGAHLLALREADLVRCEVTIEIPGGAIACARTGTDVELGGVVWLDPVETNIAVLVANRYVKVAPVEAPKPAKVEAKG